MDRYQSKENYVHDWTVEKRRGHLYSTILEENRELLEGKRVLMLGCNAGSTLALVAEYAAYTTGREINQAAWQVAKNRFLPQRHFPAGRGEVSLSCGNALAMPENWIAAYDTILALDFIEHIYPGDMPRLVAECHRVLKLGGHIIAYSPRTDYANPNAMCFNPAHVQWFESLRSFQHDWTYMSPPSFTQIEARHETRKNPNQTLAPGRHDAWFMVLQKQ